MCSKIHDVLIANKTRAEPLMNGGPRFDEGQTSSTNEGPRLDEGQTSKTNGGPRLDEGQTSRTNGGPRLDEGQTSRTNGGPRLDEGQTSRTNGGPRLDEGQTSRTNGGTRLDEGQTSRTNGGPRLDEGQTSRTNGGTRLDEGQTSRTNGGTRLDEGQTSRTNGGTRLDEGQTSRTNGGTRLDEGQTSRTNGGTRLDEGQTSRTNGGPRLDEGQTSRTNGGTRLDEGQTSGTNELLPHMTNDLSEGGAAADEGELLKIALDIVLKAKLVTGMDAAEKIVEFKHPKELKGLVDVEVGEAGCSLEEAEAVLKQVVRYSVKTQHPHFYNQLFGGIDEVALAGAWMTEALNTSQYTFEVAPVFMLVEHSVLSLLVRLYGWGEGDGIFAPGGSVSNMYSMVLARYRKHPHVKRTGLLGLKPLIAFTSDQGHYSVSKSAAWLGLGMDNVVHVASDAQGRMIPEALEEAVAAARAKGGEPFYVNATAGTTVLGAYDPLEALADVCDQEHLWLHVDGCWGGAVILSRQYKHLLKGVHRADSISWNPHKMLGTCLQCSAFLTRHKSLLHQCNSARATYLFQQDKHYDVSYDTGDKSVQCGRKVDAFKLWVFLKFHGLHLLEQRIDDAFSASRYLSQQVAARPGFRLLQEPQCTNVCFWYIPASMRGQPETPHWWAKLAKVAPELKGRMVAEGTLMIGYQPLACKNLVNFFRMVTTCTPTPTHADMDFVLDEIERLGADL